MKTTTTPVSDEFGAARILTSAGRFYIVADEEEKRARNNGKRVMFTRDEFARMLPFLKMMNPYERHLYMRDMIAIREQFPDSSIESVKSNEIPFEA